MSEAHGSATPMETDSRYSKFTEEFDDDGDKYCRRALQAATHILNAYLQGRVFTVFSHVQRSSGGRLTTVSPMDERLLFGVART